MYFISSMSLLFMSKNLSKNGQDFLDNTYYSTENQISPYSIKKKIHVFYIGVSHYCLYPRSSFLYSESLSKNGQDFLDNTYYSTENQISPYSIKKKIHVFYIGVSHYCLYPRSSFLYSESLSKNGQDFLDILLSPRTKICQSFFFYVFYIGSMPLLFMSKNSIVHFYLENQYSKMGKTFLTYCSTQN